jgi:hypothetical protein
MGIVLRFLEKVSEKVWEAACHHGVQHIPGMPPLKSGVLPRHAAGRWRGNGMPVTTRSGMQLANGMLLWESGMETGTQGANLALSMASHFF